MTTLLELMDAIAGQLQDELTASYPTLQVAPLMNFAPTPPSIDVYPADPFQEPAAYGTRNRHGFFIVRARVVPTDYDNGQTILVRLMDYDGAGSVLQALAGDWSFGGACQDATCETQTGPAIYPDPFGQGGESLLGAEWRLRVIL